jgi:hypothetical protein
VIPLYSDRHTTYEEYRRVRRDPTISLCRAVIVAPILSNVWAVKSHEGVDPQIVKFISDQMLSKRFRIMESSLHGMIDFGWQGFEKVFEVGKYDIDDEGDSPKIKKLVGLRKLKPLLQDMTSIMIYIHNGDFAGFRQGVVFVEAPMKAVLVNFRVEGTKWHGEPLLEDAKNSVYRWEVVEDGATRYDKKMAGSHFVVYYPLGTSEYRGVETPNADIAQNILKSLEASGSISVPSTLLSFVEGMENTNENMAWKVDFLSDRGARQSSFVDRLRYLDTCKTRAMHIPERAITEGQFGTKAEAEGHADIMTVILENLDYRVTDQINTQVVNHLLEVNFGPDLRGKVWLESPPISDDKIMSMRNFFGLMLGNPSGFMEIFPHVDYAQMLDQLEIPINHDVPVGAPGMGGMGMGGTAEAPMGSVDPQKLQAMQQAGLTPTSGPQPLAALLKALAQRKNGGAPPMGSETGTQAEAAANALPARLKRFSANRPPVKFPAAAPNGKKALPTGGAKNPKRGVQRPFTPSAT